MPDDLRWSWYNKNRNKCMINVMCLNHPKTIPTPVYGKKLSSTKVMPKRLGTTGLNHTNWPFLGFSHLQQESGEMNSLIAISLTKPVAKEKSIYWWSYSSSLETLLFGCISLVNKNIVRIGFNFVISATSGCSLINNAEQGIDKFSCRQHTVDEAKRESSSWSIHPLF